jgi:hypothetical protein
MISMEAGTFCTAVDDNDTLLDMSSDVVPLNQVAFEDLPQSLYPEEPTAPVLGGMLMTIVSQDENSEAAARDTEDSDEELFHFIQDILND